VADASCSDGANGLARPIADRNCDGRAHRPIRAGQFQLLSPPEQTMTCECGAIQTCQWTPGGFTWCPEESTFLCALSARALQHINQGCCLRANAGSRARSSILRGRGDSRRHAGPVRVRGMDRCARRSARFPSIRAKRRTRTSISITPPTAGRGTECARPQLSHAAMPQSRVLSSEWAETRPTEVLEYTRHRARSA
jgi:hypothetical protein